MASCRVRVECECSGAVALPRLDGATVRLTAPVCACVRAGWRRISTRRIPTPNYRLWTASPTIAVTVERPDRHCRHPAAVWSPLYHLISFGLSLDVFSRTVSTNEASEQSLAVGRYSHQWQMIGLVLCTRVPIFFFLGCLLEFLMGLVSLVSSRNYIMYR